MKNLDLHNEVENNFESALHYIVSPDLDTSMIDSYDYSDLGHNEDAGKSANCYH